MSTFVCAVCGEEDPNASKMEWLHRVHNHCHNQIAAEFRRSASAILGRVLVAPPPGFEDLADKHREISQRLAEVNKLSGTGTWGPP